MPEMLRFMTCGNVDGGKSTLLGALLYNANLLYDDQKQSMCLQTDGEETINYSSMMDGLMVEQAQNITIDVSYKYFSTNERKFIVADTPGHLEYTRNMMVAASNVDLAIVLVDVLEGIVEQTKRHIRICDLVGIKYYIFVINKMDLVGYSQAAYQKIYKKILKLVKNCHLKSSFIIPVSAKFNENIISNSKNMPWYKADCLLRYLESIHLDKDENMGFVMPVQRISKVKDSYRGIQGLVEAGKVSIGEKVIILPSKEKGEIKNIRIGKQEVNTVHTNRSITVELNEHIDVARGDVLCRNAELFLENKFVGSLCWFDKEQIDLDKEYILQIGTQELSARIQKVLGKLNLETGKYENIEEEQNNNILLCEISTIDQLVFSIFKVMKALGTFIMIDRVSNLTVACGVVVAKIEISKEKEREKDCENPLTLWFTGLSGSGKTTVSKRLESKLISSGYLVARLDGDEMRSGLNSDLGFERWERRENVRRIAEVAKLMNKIGITVLIAVISPYENDRKMAREIIVQLRNVNR